MDFLKGKKTYIADILLVLVAVQGVIPQLHVIPADATVVVLGILGGAVALFRFLATACN